VLVNRDYKKLYTPRKRRGLWSHKSSLELLYWKRYRFDMDHLRAVRRKLWCSYMSAFAVIISVRGYQKVYTFTYNWFLTKVAKM
jgi:hypothetical protein